MSTTWLESWMGWKVRGKSNFPEVMCFSYCLAGRKRMEIVICQNKEDWERKIIPRGMESYLRLRGTTRIIFMKNHWNTGTQAEMFMSPMTKHKTGLERWESFLLGHRTAFSSAPEGSDWCITVSSRVTASEQPWCSTATSICRGHSSTGVSLEDRQGAPPVEPASERTREDVCAPSLSRVRLCVSPWSAARQAPLSMGILQARIWSGLPCPPPGDLPNPGIEPRSPTLQTDSLPSEPPGEPKCEAILSIINSRNVWWVSPRVLSHYFSRLG